MNERQAWMALVDGLNDPLAVTLASNHELSPEALGRCADEFFNRVERQALGTRWHTKPQSQRLKVVGFFEHLATNIHLHAAVEAPGRAASVLVNGLWIWRKVRPGGSYDCGPVRAKWSRYITKDLWADDADRRLYVRFGRT